MLHSHLRLVWNHRLPDVHVFRLWEDAGVHRGGGKAPTYQEVQNNLPSCYEATVPTTAPQYHRV